MLLRLYIVLIKTKLFSYGLIWGNGILTHSNVGERNNCYISDNIFVLNAIFDYVKRGNEEAVEM